MCRLGTEWALRLHIELELHNFEKGRRRSARRRWAGWETS